MNNKEFKKTLTNLERKTRLAAYLQQIQQQIKAIKKLNKNLAAAESLEEKAKALYEICEEYEDLQTLADLEECKQFNDKDLANQANWHECLRIVESAEEFDLKTPFAAKTDRLYIHKLCLDLQKAIRKNCAGRCFRQIADDLVNGVWLLSRRCGEAKNEENSNNTDIDAAAVKCV